MESEKRNEYILFGVAAVALLLGFWLNVLLGLGLLVGIGIGVLYRFLADAGEVTEQEEQDSNLARFVDTAVMQENFPIPQNLPVPYAVLNIRGNLLVFNKRFRDLFPTDEDAMPLIEELMKKSGAGESVEVQVADRFYQGAIEPCDVVEETGAVGTVLTLILVDGTKEHELQDLIIQKQSVVANIFLDNYDEVVDSLDENRVPILTALIDRKLGQMAAETDGMLRKLEKDRYIFLLTREKLELLKEKKFAILTEIKEINVGEHIPATISVGVGIGVESLEIANQNSKAAMDLALGRGGDQVIIKDDEKFFFYGGKSGGVEKNSRIRARVKADALWELLDTASLVLVMGHKNADLDSIGSCMGISAIARGMDKRCHIVMDGVSTGIQRFWNNLEESGQYQGLAISTAEAMRMVDENTVVIVVDTYRSSLVESLPVLEAVKRIVVFDHHRKSTDFIEQAVLTYHEPFASSTSELVTEMIQHIGKKVKLRSLEADALLAGITVDTKNFSIKTGAITFESAGFLRRNGADSIRVKMLFQNDMESYRAKAAAVKDAEIVYGEMAISVCPPVHDMTVVAAQAADELINVTGIRASFVLSQMEETIYISARSYGSLNVQRMMEKLGGGGHLTVAGAQLTDCTMDEAKAKLRHAIEEYLEEEE